MSNENASPPPPPSQVKCPNPRCGQQRPAADHYCGVCGGPLQADIHQLVKWALEEQTEDGEVFQVETAKKIADKVWAWGKWFIGIAGISTVFLVLALALVGYKSIADIDKSRADAEKAAKEAKEAMKEAARETKESIKDLKTDAEKASLVAKESIKDIE
jgi:hypothetical protein